MGRIQILTDRVANQIAAGEVVERPASVCKELIENALDAGSSRLRIELRGGGRRLIEVSDNGSGMSRDDAMLAFERHATSKLRQASDLLAISTLGFRGEALPSIASVARVTLRTRLPDDESGTLVEMHGGRLGGVRDEAAAPGTTVTVRNLFYNVPARRKFLRTEKTELAHAVRIATHCSLAHLDKTIELRTEHGSLLKVTPVRTLRERVYQVFGSETLDRLVEVEPVEREAGPDGDDPAAALRLSGFVSEPQSQRSNRNSVYIFVNRRLVRDSLIQKAVFAAYENLMPKGVYPFVVLFLETAPEAVDVNVHPAKTEVRFRSPSTVFDFVRDAVRAQLVAAKPAADLPLPAEPARPNGFPAGGSAAAQSPAPRYGAAKWGASSVAPRFDFPVEAALPVPLAWEPAAPPPGAAPPEAAAGADPSHTRAPLDESGPTSLVNLTGLRLLGQVHDSFIVAAGEDGLWIIDQHVAHERILFEKVLADRLHGRVAMQQLLMPVILTLAAGQEVSYERLAEEFAGNGFEIEPFGPRTIAVKAAPAELSAPQVEALLHDLLDESREPWDGLSLGELRKRMAATIACHAAVKVNMPLTTEKMRWMLDELARSECPMSCPHGRPIALKYGTRDILKAFHRI